MRLSTTSDGRLSREALDQIFHVDTERRLKRQRMLETNKRNRAALLAKKRAAAQQASQSI